MEMNRRAVLVAGGAWALYKALTATTPVSAQSANKEKQSKVELTGEQWMRAWMSQPLDTQSPKVRDEDGALILGRFVEPIYFLTKSIKWKPNADQTKFSAVSVPVGFVTDLASIPRAFWSLLRPDGEYVYPAIVHDYLYWTQTTERETADMILKMGMEDFGIGSSTINTIYGAVRAGGGKSWSGNAALKRSGEKRVLKAFPTDPRTRWKNWKSNPAVFSD